MANPQNRIVHYVMTDGSCRPFLVTRTWNEQTANGTLFIDGSNDYSNVPYFNNPGNLTSPLLTVWKTSVANVEATERASNTWHWPEREDV